MSEARILEQPIAQPELKRQNEWRVNNRFVFLRAVLEPRRRRLVTCKPDRECPGVEARAPRKWRRRRVLSGSRTPRVAVDAEERM